MDIVYQVSQYLDPLHMDVSYQVSQYLDPMHINIYYQVSQYLDPLQYTWKLSTRLDSTWIPAYGQCLPG
jgi:hypothetical protein